jgi:hypothetical protein
MTASPGPVVFLRPLVSCFFLLPRIDLLINCAITNKSAAQGADNTPRGLTRAKEVSHGAG